MGELKYNKSETVISIPEWDWHCILSPRMWFPLVAKVLSRDGKKRMLRLSFHPCDITKTDDFMDFSRKMAHQQMNVHIDERNKILRSNGWKVEMSLPYSGKREIFGSALERPLPPIHYPEYEPRQKKPDESDMVKNNEFLMSKLSPNNPPEVLELHRKAQKFALFLCEEGHEYYGLIKEQSQYGCPVCSGDRVIPGVNDLATTDPELAKNWDYDGSFPYLPEDVSRQSDRKMSWICPESGARWERTVNGYVASKGASPFTINVKLHPGYNDIATRFPELALLHSPENETGLDEICSIQGHGSMIWECPNCGGRWERTLESMVKFRRCMVCSREYRSSSIGERELLSYVKGIPGSEKVFSNDRSLVGKEIDVYIPSLKVAIEFNGLYWHSEATGKDIDYHYEKWRKCKDKGVDLMIVWEDEWASKKDVVKRVINAKISSSTNRLDEDLIALPIDDETASRFMDQNHIYGHDENASLHFGLMNKDGTLMSVTSWRVHGTDLFLSRHSQTFFHEDGFQDILSFVKSYAALKSCNRILVVDNHHVSMSNIYEMSELENDGEIRPALMYVDSNKDVRHMMKYSLIDENPHLTYIPGKTEAELAQINNLHRIWDCGKTRYVMNV